MGLCMLLLLHTIIPCFAWMLYSLFLHFLALPAAIPTSFSILNEKCFCTCMLLLHFIIPVLLTADIYHGKFNAQFMRKHEGTLSVVA